MSLLSAFTQTLGTCFLFFFFKLENSIIGKISLLEFGVALNPTEGFYSMQSPLQAEIGENEWVTCPCKLPMD